MVDGLNIDNQEALDRNCEGCAIGKQHRQPFPTKSQSTATKLLELIHSDVCAFSGRFKVLCDFYRRFLKVNYCLYDEAKV